MDHEALVLRLREDLLATESELSALISQREAGLLQAAEIDTAYELERLQGAAHMSELRMEQDRVAATGQRVVLATRGGYVDTLEAQVGMITQPGITLLSIVSGESELRARLLIPDRAVAGVGIGQALILRFDAFPHQHFGTVPAQLVSLASTISASGETLGPFRPTEPVYLGEAHLVKGAESVDRWPIDLREGMRFTADLELEHRTLLAWLLEPLIGLRRTRA
jgi:membrane fusion protein